MKQELRSRLDCFNCIRHGNIQCAVWALGIQDGDSTHIIAERYKAGDSLQDLVEDYDCDLSQIEEAIRCEIPLAA